MTDPPPSMLASEEPVPVNEELDPEKYLAFELDGCMLALPLSSVHSVLRPVPVTPVPALPPAVLGAINLRSEIVPLLDLGRLMGRARREVTASSRFLVLEDQGRLRAVVVDRLHEVLKVAEQDLVAEPDSLERGGARYLQGLVRVGPELYSVLDPAAVGRYLVGEEGGEPPAPATSPQRER